MVGAVPPEDIPAQFVFTCFHEACEDKSHIYVLDEVTSINMLPEVLVLKKTVSTNLLYFPKPHPQEVINFCSAPFNVDNSTLPFSCYYNYTDKI